MAPTDTPTAHDRHGCNTLGEMQIRRMVIGAVALTLILAAPGCGSPNHTQPTAIEAQDRMETLLRKGNTGSFGQRMVSMRDTGSVTIHEDGSYNLADESWSIRVRYASEPVELLEPMPRLQRMGTDVIYTDHRLYISRPGWPKRLRGRWTEEAPTADAPAANASANRAERPIRAFFPAALISMNPIALTPNGPGWTLRGQIGIEVALEALGLDVAALRKNNAGPELTGQGEVTVELGPDYAPRQVRVDGNTISVKAGLPESVAKEIVFMRTTTVLSALGTAPPITAPAKKDLFSAGPSKSA